jgi:hypothetical protein
MLEHKSKLMGISFVLVRMMGLYPEAVKLALDDEKLFSQAKIYADKPQSLEARKKLWL